MERDPFTMDYLIRIGSGRLLDMASADAVAQMVFDEVRKALVEDDSFRILVREGVREAMSKLNVAELVEASVRQVLGEQKEK